MSDREPERPQIAQVIPLARKEIVPEKKERSLASAPHTIAAALEAAEPFLGKVEWDFPPAGKALKTELPALQKELDECKDLIDSIAQQGGVDRVNTFLKKKGFTIQLKSGQNSPQEIATASVMDIKVQWKTPGSKKPVSLEEKKEEVPGVYIAEKQQMYACSGHPHPIIRLETKSGDRVFMTKYEQAPRNQDALRSAIRDFSLNKTPLDKRRVHFPMIDFEESGHINELIGASTQAKDGLPAVISQAEYQHRLRMNEIGARAQAAAAIMIEKGMPLVEIIDGNFLVWFERGDEKQPVTTFSAYITKQHMKEPAGLD